MKITLFIPLATAALGFALGWAVKPSNPASAKTAQEKSSGQPAADGKSTRSPDLSETGRPTRSDGSRAEKLHPLPDYTPASVDDAKWLRLTEILGLKDQQREEMKLAISDVLNAPSTTTDTLQDLIARGNALEVALSKILNPEQLEKFEQLRQRERDNRTEVQAQQTLNTALKGVDLTSEQRLQIIGRLRQYAREKVQTVPASAALLLEDSILPVGEQPISGEMLASLAEIQNAPPEPEEPAAAYALTLQRRRESVERLLQCFEGVLTPAQTAQYQISLAKQQQLLESLPINGGN